MLVVRACLFGLTSRIPKLLLAAKLIGQRFAHVGEPREAIQSGALQVAGMCHITLRSSPCWHTPTARRRRMTVGPRRSRD